MKNIVCKLTNSDVFAIDEASVEVNLINKEDYHSTFYNLLRRLYQFPKFFNYEALDLFYISLMVLC